MGDSNEYNSDYYGDSYTDIGLPENCTDTDCHQTNYDFHYEEFIYPGFTFERPIYLVLWECLVLWTILFNVIVVIILLRKKLRNPSNIILVFIAVSDSLTVLVTLPTYIYVYGHFGSGHHTSDTGTDKGDWYADDDYMLGSLVAYSNNSTIASSNTSFVTSRNSSDVDNSAYYHGDDTRHYDDFGVLTKTWCQSFMITKYFVTKVFHTVSIWLTLFLGIQRYVAVRYPFKAKQIFTINRTIVVAFVIYFLSPWLHVYHLLDEKARDSDGMCEWKLEKTCEGGCAYLWLSFLLMHFLPCLFLVIFSILMIISLYKSSAAAKELTNRKKSPRQSSQNTRFTIVVSTIVIVFLIPEIPYGFFLLYSVMLRHFSSDIMSLETNRTFHAVYELMLVITFHANFWIYTILNRRFRVELRNTFSFLIGPLYRTIGTSLRRRSTRSTEVNTKSRVRPEEVATEMEPLEDKYSGPVPHSEQGQKTPI